MKREAERKRLVEKLSSATLDRFTIGDRYSIGTIQKVADHLLDNGIVVPRCKPIGVMNDGSEFNFDVYCPYCCTNLSGYYGEEATIIIQCYNCGEFLDSTKIITRKEAEKALEGGAE